MGAYENASRDDLAAIVRAAGRHGSESLDVDTLAAVNALARIAGDLMRDGVIARDVGRINSAIETWQLIIDALPKDEPQRLGLRANVCGLLQQRFELTRNTSDLDAAIVAGREALLATRPGSANRAACLSNLAGALRSRSTLVGAEDDLDEAIALMEEAVRDADAGDGRYAVGFANLGNALRERYKRSGRQPDADRAVALLGEALRATPAGLGERVRLRTCLARVYLARYDRTRLLTELDQAMSALAEIPESVSATRWDLIDRRFELVIALFACLDHTQAAEDADRVIAAAEELLGLRSGDPRLLGIASSLAGAYWWRFERSGADADLRRAIDLRRQILRSDETGDASRVRELSDLTAALMASFYRTARRAELEEAIGCGREALEAGGPEHPLRVMMLANLASALRARARLADEADDLDEAIDLLYAAEAATQHEGAESASVASHLGNALNDRFHRRGDIADLESAIVLARTNLATTPPGAPSRSLAQSSLAGHLLDWCKATGDTRELDEAIELARGAVELARAGHPNRGWIRDVLIRALDARIRRAASQGDLEDYLAAVEEAVLEYPDGGGLKVLLSLGAFFHGRFADMGSSQDLDTAGTVYERALRAASADATERADLLLRSSDVLGLKSTGSDDPAALDAYISRASEAAAAIIDDVGRGRFLVNLVGAYGRRFERTRSRADLEAAIDLGREALGDAPFDPEDRAVILGDLSKARQDLFVLSGDPADLDGAVDAGRLALSICPEDDGYQRAVTPLALALKDRFRYAGDPRDIDEAVSLCRQAVRTATEDSPGHASALSNLGLALRARFLSVGMLKDIDEAVEVSRRAAAVERATGWPQGALSNFGSSLIMRFGRTRAREDVDEAIDACREALTRIDDDDPRIAIGLQNLCSSLMSRFTLSPALRDLNEAVEIAGRAVEHTSRDHPELPIQLANFGVMLETRFRFAAKKDDLDRSIEVGRSAVRLMRADHPQRAHVLSKLGDALKLRSERTAGMADLYEAQDAYTAAVGVTTAAPSQRISAARNAAGLATLREQEGRAADLLETAVRLLPETVRRELGRGDQQYALGRQSGLVNEAAAFVLQHQGTHGLGEDVAGRALTLLEHGRAVLLHQALDTRGDLDDLRQRSPEFAARFATLRDRLDAAAVSGDLLSASDTESAGRPGFDTDDRHRTAAEFARTMADIRAMKGFEAFMQPPDVSELIAEGTAGPIVVFNVSEIRSDALLLADGVVRDLPLTGLRFDELMARIEMFHDALAIVTYPSATRPTRLAAQSALSDTLEWLWDVAAGPVLDALGYHGEPTASERWPRVWWAPGGLLGLLPIHAAGYHRTSAAERRTVIDRVVSSYTPTVRALRYARRAAPAATRQRRALIVGMPLTPGASPLRCVPDEVRRLSARLPLHELLLAGTADTPAPTKSTVLGALMDCAIAHFACHGMSDATNPSLNRLLLCDHETDALTVDSLASVRLDQAELAYLSACRTALADSADLADEAIHLAGAFQLAGFRHVVGTLWEIDDEMATHFADAFYDGLADETGTINTDRSAEALHRVVRSVRDRLPRTPSLWASHLHAGA